MAEQERITILGGGLAGLATAFELTATPALRARYQVTLYQSGWRLGGKCASSRGKYGRIEEHGLHVLLGAYENAFQVLRRLYQELDRPAGAKLARFEQAFLRHDEVVFVERIGGELRPWRIQFPRNNETPGDGGLWPGPAEYLRMMAQWQRVGAGLLARELLRRLHPLQALRDGRGHLRRLARLLQQLTRLATGKAGGADGETALLRSLLDALRDLGHDWLQEDDALRRLWILLDLSTTCSSGMIRDDLLRRGMSAVDDEDFRAWLRRHGASSLSLDSALLRAVYDLVFHAPAGDSPDSGFAAGTALRMTLRFVAGYKGSVGWWMAAGTGETLIAPFYEVLARRGVRFEFFQRIDRLDLDAAGLRLEAIRLHRQATPRDGTYRPLIDVGGLPCWPDKPLYDQLVEGEALREGGHDLESSWSGWPGVGGRVLRRGADFDRAVLAISLAALPPLCQDLQRHHPRWRAMFATMQTTPTIALQVWSDRPRAAAEGKPMMNTGVTPLTGFGDMTHLIEHEDWQGQRPAHVLHVCNRLEVPAPPPPDGAAHSYPQDMQAHAGEVARRWLAEDGGAAMVPDATAPMRREPPDWSVLHDEHERSGPARFEDQYWRLNVEPTDRYVLSVPGSARTRLRADESGVTNLVLAGTWTRTGLDVGSVEAAILSGRAASRAISGEPRIIAGERDFQ